MRKHLPRDNQDSRPRQSRTVLGSNADWLVLDKKRGGRGSKVILWHRCGAEVSELRLQMRMRGKTPSQVVMCGRCGESVNVSQVRYKMLNHKVVVRND